MDTPVAPVAPEQTTHRLVVENHRVRRPLGPLFWLAVVAVPVALTALVGSWRGPAVEGALKADARHALVAAHLKGVGLVVDGRQVTAKVPTGRDPHAVEAVLAAVPGVLSVETTEVYASAAEARACKGIQGKIDRVTHDQQIPFAGASTRLTPVGERMVREVGRLLRACRAAEATVGGHTDTSTNNGSTISLERARVIIRALGRAGVKASRLEPRGYGDQFPLSTDDTPAGRARNERGSIAVKER